MKFDLCFIVYLFLRDFYGDVNWFVGGINCMQICDVDEQVVVKGFWLMVLVKVGNFNIYQFMGNIFVFYFFFCCLDGD